MLNNDKLLESKLLLCKLSREELRHAHTDEDWLPNKIGGEMNTVLTVSLDESSMPGSCGVSWISEWRGLYFFTSSDVSPEGPFETLQEAMNVELLSGFSEGFSFESDDIPDAELVAYVADRFIANDGATVVINGEMLEWVGTTLEPVETNPEDEA